MSYDFLTLPEEKLKEIRLPQNLSWLSLVICVLLIVLRLISEQSTSRFSLPLTAFFGVAIISFINFVYSSTYFTSTQSRKIHSNWKKYKYIWIVFSIFFLIISLECVYTFYKNPLFIRMDGLSGLDLILLLLIFLSGMVVVRMQRLTQKVSLRLPEYSTEGGIYFILSVLAVLAVIQAVKLSFDESLAPLLTMIALVSASTGGLANFVMSFARGLKDIQQAELTHRAGGWLLRQAIVLTGSGLSIIPGILNFDIVKEWTISMFLILNYSDWIKIAFPSIGILISKNGYQDHFLDDLNTFIGLALIIITLTAIGVFSYTIIKVTIGLRYIYNWISDINDKFKPFELSFSPEYRDSVKQFEELEKDSEDLRREIRDLNNKVRSLETEINPSEGEINLPPSNLSKE